MDQPSLASRATQPFFSRFRVTERPFFFSAASTSWAAGVYLLSFEFSYTGYLAFSLALGCLSALDSLAYESLYPNLIPDGFEEKGYTVSGMIYPVLQIVMSPVSALLYETIGVANILLLQSGLSLLAALIESRIKIAEVNRMNSERFSLNLWLNDLKSAARYLKEEKGLQSIFAYMAVTNGVGNGHSPLIIAFFRTAPGFTMAMYSFFFVAEFAGRSLGGLFHYHAGIPPKKRFSFAFAVYLLYESMDMALLWLPYPLMLLNRGVCGFLGINSASMRAAAVQRYIPDEYRSRINAFNGMLSSVSCLLFALILGSLGEWVDPRVCVTAGGAFAALVCLATIGRRRAQVRRVYEGGSDAA